MQEETGPGPEAKELLRRVDRLLTGVYAAKKPGAFLEQHLDEFDDHALAMIAILAHRARAAGDTELADQLIVLITGVHNVRSQLGPRRRYQGRFMRVKTREELAALVDEWPEVLNVANLIMLDKVIRGIREVAPGGSTTHLEQIQAWLYELQADQPLLVALLDFVATGTWDEAQEFAREKTLLHSAEALDLLEELADKAAGRGEERMAETYREHRERLARWQEMGFAPQG